jgi:hypothetical protein
MDPSEINNFEDQWRKALKEASEAPPQSVWEGIEARLDQQEDKGLIVPLWQSAKLWYAAASIAALLLVGGGIWYSNSGMNGDKAENQIAVKENVQSAETGKAAQKPEVTEENQASASENEASASENQALAFEKSSEPTSRAQQGTIRSDAKGSSAAGKEAVAAKEAVAGRQVYATRKTVDQQPGNPDAALATAEKPVIISKDNDKSQEIAASTAKESVINSELVTAKQPEITLAMLAAQPYNDLDVHMQKRYVFFRPDANKAEGPSAPAKNTEYYAALSLMPASFNPNLTVKEAPLGFSSQSLSTKKSVSGTSEAGASYAVQTQGGVKLSKHWSVEMGISYLKGNSTYEGGGYVLNAYNSRSANVLENALAGVAPNSFVGMNGDKSADFVNNGALYIDVAKKVSNNYQYLQLPVQAGFTLYPENKLSYSVLGGMMANFFLSNELESASGEIITTKASDEVYRSMNWAATTGLRFNYRLSPRWNANLTGSYQKSVTSGFRSNQSLESRPYLYGVSWGMRYSF